MGENDKLEMILEMLKDPELAPTVHETIDAYKKPVYRILGEFVDIWKDFQNSEYYSLTAAGKKKMFDAYIAAGFSEEQAMMLLLNDHLEAAAVISKLNAKKKN